MYEINQMYIFDLRVWMLQEVAGKWFPKAYDYEQHTDTILYHMNLSHEEKLLARDCCVVYDVDTVLDLTGCLDSGIL